MPDETKQPSNTAGPIKVPIPAQGANNPESKFMESQTPQKGSDIPVPSSKTPAPPADTKASDDASLTVGSKDKLNEQASQAVQTTKATSDEPLYVPNHPTTHKNKNELISVMENIGGVAGRTWRGVCRKCGWQTHQPTKQNAVEAVADHVTRHAAPATEAESEAVAPEPTPRQKLVESQAKDKQTPDQPQLQPKTAA